MLSLVGEGGVAADHEDAGQARQIRGQALGHAVDEIIMRGIAAQIGEGQNDERRFARRRGAAGRRRCRRPGASWTAADETDALARKRLDEPLLVSGIADRLPHRIEARGQSDVRDGAALPNGAYQIVLADDAFAVADQIAEQVEHLRRDGDDLRPATKLASFVIE